MIDSAPIHTVDTDGLRYFGWIRAKIFGMAR